MHIRYAVLGAGAIAPTHAWAIERCASAELAMVCDIDRGAAARLASEVMHHRDGSSVAIAGDWREALDDPDVDAVAVCLPHHLHEAAIFDSLSAGKAVLVEKPAVISLDGVRRIRALIAERDSGGEATGPALGGVFQHRFSPLVDELRRFVADREAGDLRRVDIDFTCERTPDYYRSGYWRGTWRTEGGALLINQAIHTVDLAVHLVGMPDSIGCTVERRRPELEIEAEDYAEGMVAWNDHITGSLRAENRHGGGWRPLIRLTFAHGRIELNGSEHVVFSGDWDADTIRRFDEAAAGAVEAARAVTPSGKDEWSGLHAFNVDDFTNALIDSRSPAVSIASAVDTVELVLGCYTSSADGARVAFPLDHFRRPSL